MTVDFVILTASVIVMFMLTIEPVYTGSRAMVSQISDKLLSHAEHTWERN